MSLPSTFTVDNLAIKSKLSPHKLSFCPGSASAFASWSAFGSASRSASGSTSGSASWSAYSPASGLLPVCSKSAPGLLLDCSWSHLSLLPVYFQSVSSLLQVCYKSTSSMFPVCSHSASRRLAVYFQPASMLLVKYLSRGLKFAINGWTVCSSSKLHSPFIYFPVGVHCLIVLAVIALQSSRHDEIRKLKLWKRLTKTLRVYLY